MKSGLTKPLKILVVEDDLPNRMLLQKSLHKSPLPISEVKSAESLNAAFELLDNNHFDVVLLDLNLPDSTALDTLVRISEKYPQLPNVVITGKYDNDLGLKAIARGAQDYLIKGGYNIDTLSKSINYAIERKKVERKLQLAEERYRTIFENSAVAITMADEQQRLISWNRLTEQLLGMNKEDLHLRPVKSLYPPGEWERIKIHNVRQKGMQHHLETKMFKKNGQVIDIDISLSVLKNSEGKTTGSIGIIRDITERKKAEEKAEETMEVKSQFISMVSHELQTPLACIKEGVSIVLDEVVGKINNKQRNFLNTAKRNVERLANLVNDILDFQKLEAGKTKLNIQENNINEVIGEAYQIMVSSAKKKGINFSIKLEDNLPRARFDGDKIIQVLTNLISNAIKFTPEHEQVSVCVQHRNGQLVIRVSDTGMGIPEDALPKIFDRFYRVHRPGKQIQGTGLGLAIVKKIVMTHGGRSEVESDVDQATTFTVFLPLETKPIPDLLPQNTDELLENNIVNS